MKRKAASAMLLALILLAVVTLVSVPAMTMLAQWRSGYQQLIAREKKTLDHRYAQWTATQAEPTDAP